MSGSIISAAPAIGSQATFATTLLDPERACPAGLRTWNGSDPARRLAVYRNNVISSLINALADTFPVTQALVGTEFFRAMAAVFVRRSPPRSPILAHYGEAFGPFIDGFEPAAGLPYLADVARLEYARMRACHAADAEPMAEAALAHALAHPDALAAMRIEWHPSLCVVSSPHAVVTLWAAHQTEGEVPMVEVDGAEHAIVLRDGFDVFVLPVDAGTAHFVATSWSGASFGAAAAAAAGLHPPFDLSAALSLLLRHRALVALHAPYADSLS